MTPAKLKIVIDDGKDKSEYNVPRNHDKESDHQPDFKKDDVVVWDGMSSKGKRMLSIRINGQKFYAFLNGFKTEPTHPDFNIMPPFQ